MIDLSDKKKFLSWLVQSIALKQRESYWIINYLINHEAILNRVSFVEGALYTPRGILITDQTVSGVGLEMVNKNEKLILAEDIFSDIRKNRKEQLFLEIRFDQMYQLTLYQSVIEENNYLPINSEEQMAFYEEFEGFLEEEKQVRQKEKLSEAINQALNDNNKEEFIRLTNEYVLLQKESDHF